MKLNHQDLLKQARLLGLYLPDNIPPEEVIEYTKRHIAGEKIRTIDMDHPLMELRATMMTWVEDHFSTISAQHKGTPDCIACPAARVVGCFLENRKFLERGGYISQEDPWLLE